MYGCSSVHFRNITMDLFFVCMLLIFFINVRDYGLPSRNVGFEFATTTSAIDKTMQAANKPSESTIIKIIKHFD